MTIETSPNRSYVRASYMCGLCNSNSVLFFFEMLEWVRDPNSGSPGRWHHEAVRKIGQNPPQDISISADLDEQLGVTAQHYKKALITREQNYGIAAMAYMRRVVDEKTDDLIDIMADLARTHQIPEGEIDKLLKVKTDTRYDRKLETAANLIPQALRPGGVNPLGQLYKQTSTGLHGKSDDECVAIFDDIRADFEYIFRNLHNEAQERREFVKRMQERAGKS